MAEINGLSPRRGLFFEEFEVGQQVTSMGRTVTEADIVSFAALTGDWTALHTDAVYAAQSHYGQRIAHGLLGLSLASALAVRLGFMEDTVLAFREIQNWKFSQPILIGDTIRVRITVTDTQAVKRMGGGMVTFEAEVLNQADKVAQHGSWRVLIKGRAPGDPS